MDLCCAAYTFPLKIKGNPIDMKCSSKRICIPQGVPGPPYLARYSRTREMLARFAVQGRIRAMPGVQGRVRAVRLFTVQGPKCAVAWLCGVLYLGALMGVCEAMVYLQRVYWCNLVWRCIQDPEGVPSKWALLGPANLLGSCMQMFIKFQL